MIASENSPKTGADLSALGGHCTPLRGRLISRRNFLGLGASATAVMTLAACDTSAITSVFEDTPEPNAVLREVEVSLRSAAATAGEKGSAGLQKFYTAQATAVNDEVLRQCGVDDQGNHPESCTTADTAESREESDSPKGDTGAGETAAKDPQAAYLDAIALGPRDQPELRGDEFATQVSILTGLYTAYATSQNAADIEGLEALDAAKIGEEVEESDGLTQLLQLTYSAIYASGLVLAADGGAHRAVLATITARLRELRDDIVDMLKVQQAAIPVPEPAYRPMEGQAAPSNATQAASFFHGALLPITAELRSLASQAPHAEGRAFFARWCGINARGEAALENILGEDPLSIISRG